MRWSPGRPWLDRALRACGVKVRCRVRWGYPQGLLVVPVDTASGGEGLTLIAGLEVRVAVGTIGLGGEVLERELADLHVVVEADGEGRDV